MAETRVEEEKGEVMVPWWRPETNCETLSGALKGCVFIESSDRPLGEKEAPNLDDPLLLKKPSSEASSAYCEITSTFEHPHEIRQVYVRSTARVYELYYKTEANGENEYLCTVRCGPVQIELDTATEDLSQGTDKSASVDSSDEDGWLEVNVPGAELPTVVVDNSIKEIQAKDSKTNVTFYEATAEIADVSPCISLTVRLLSVQTKDFICIEEIYIFVEPGESFELANPPNPAGNSANASFLSMLVPSLLQLSKASPTFSNKSISTSVKLQSSNDCGSSKENEVQEDVAVEVIEMENKSQQESSCDQVSLEEIGNDNNGKESSNLQFGRTSDFCECEHVKQLSQRLDKIEAGYLTGLEQVLKPLLAIESRLSQLEQKLDKVLEMQQPCGVSSHEHKQSSVPHDLSGGVITSQADKSEVSGSYSEENDESEGSGSHSEEDDESEGSGSYSEEDDDVEGSYDDEDDETEETSSDEDDDNNGNLGEDGAEESFSEVDGGNVDDENQEGTGSKVSEAPQDLERFVSCANTMRSDCEAQQHQNANEKTLQLQFDTIKNCYNKFTAMNNLDMSVPATISTRRWSSTDDAVASALSAFSTSSGLLQAQYVDFANTYEEPKRDLDPLPYYEESYGLTQECHTPLRVDKQELHLDEAALFIDNVVSSVGNEPSESFPIGFASSANTVQEKWEIPKKTMGYILEEDQFKPGISDSCIVMVDEADRLLTMEPTRWPGYQFDPIEDLNLNLGLSNLNILNGKLERKSIGIEDYWPLQTVPVNFLLKDRSSSWKLERTEFTTPNHLAGVSDPDLGVTFRDDDGDQVDHQLQDTCKDVTERLGIEFNEEIKPSGSVVASNER